MKYRVQIILLAIGFINFSCDDEELMISDEFKGTWQWHSTCGGVVGCLYAKDYPRENKYLQVIDDFTIRTIQSTGSTATVYYQIRNITTRDNFRIYEIELDNGARYSASVGDNVMTRHREDGLPFSTAYKRLR